MEDDDCVCGVSVKEIQSALGLSSNQAVYAWFNGKTLPTLYNLFALSRLFEGSMESMIVSEVEDENFVRKGNLLNLNLNSLIRIREYQRQMEACA